MKLKKKNFPLQIVTLEQLLDLKEQVYVLSSFKVVDSLYSRKYLTISTILIAEAECRSIREGTAENINEFYNGKLEKFIEFYIKSTILRF